MLNKGELNTESNINNPPKSVVRILLRYLNGSSKEIEHITNITTRKTTSTANAVILIIILKFLILYSSNTSVLTILLVKAKIKGRIVIKETNNNSYFEPYQSGTKLTS